MITPNQNLLCEQAKIYYYDFLFLQNKSVIPEFILNHFRTCQNCQKQIYELKTMLTQAQSNKIHGYGRSGSVVSNMLKLHFSYVDQKITCKTVRPFLPGLLDDSLQISVPTPITTHLDHCPDCTLQVNTIKRTVEIYQAMPKQRVPGEVQKRLLVKLNLPCDDK